MEQGSEDVLEVVQPISEAFQNLCCSLRCGAGGTAFEQPPFGTLFCFDGREVGQSQKVLALEVRPLCHELRAPLIVDDPCNRIGESALFGLAGGL